jgi:hypothetical protein
MHKNFQDSRYEKARTKNGPENRGILVDEKNERNARRTREMLPGIPKFLVGWRNAR